MPSPGKIDFYHQPRGPNVRIDSGACCHSSIEPYYDSLIAKIIVHGQTRGDAIKTMQRALGEYHIEGVKTTVDFHRQLLQDPSFCCGNIDTQFINRKSKVRGQNSEIIKLKPEDKNQESILAVGN